MSRYRIVCTEQTDCSQNGHIVAVGTGDIASKANERWTVQQVYTAMNSGDTFYTEGGGKTARVKAYDCPCGRGSLRSTSDATTANNLDEMRLCSWS